MSDASIRVAVALLVVLGVAPLAASGQDSLSSCARIDDDATRLACYDRLAGRAGSARAAPEPSASPAVAASAGAPAPLAPASAAASAVAAAPAVADPVADFGLSERVIRERSPETNVDSISGKVTNVSLTASDRYVITLDNGQVWAQSETNTRAILAPGDSVTIKRAAMGSFKLSGPRSVYWRVRRVR